MADEIITHTHTYIHTHTMQSNCRRPRLAKLDKVVPIHIQLPFNNITKKSTTENFIATAVATAERRQC